VSIYDRLSSVYSWLTISERPYRERALELLDVQPGERILEIGCGTGQALFELAAVVGETGSVMGLDLSPGMLQQSRRKLGESPGSIVSLLRGSGVELPLAADCCDALFMSFTLELFDLEEQHQVLDEARRVLRENGRLALVTLSTYQQTLPMSLYYSLHEIFPRIIDCRPIDPAPLLAAAGFLIIKQENRAMLGLPLSIIVAKMKNFP
jgi:ubiquinone/menaquinone biosynthesis C-methylase UbiE